jgi:hypothetical protein
MFKVQIPNETLAGFCKIEYTLYEFKISGDSFSFRLAGLNHVWKKRRVMITVRGPDMTTYVCDEADELGVVVDQMLALGAPERKKMVISIRITREGAMEYSLLTRKSFRKFYPLFGQEVRDIFDSADDRIAIIKVDIHNNFYQGELVHVDDLG